MKKEIIIPILLMLVAIFYKFFYKLNIAIFGEDNPRNWHFENEKTEKVVTTLMRLIIFSLGLGGLIYTLFFDKG